MGMALFGTRTVAAAAETYGARTYWRRESLESAAGKRSWAGAVLLWQTRAETDAGGVADRTSRAGEWEWSWRERGQAKW